MAHQTTTIDEPTETRVNKWEALRELGTAREAFGLSDRDLSVLQALISFHPETDLEGPDLVVHPSNASICERLNGMPCSTMRRHIARLVTAGILIRRDSPNGKRYARKSAAGKVAFGFDLTPLVTRFETICAEAERIRAEAEAVKRLRETVSLMRRDLAALAEWGRHEHPTLTIWDAYEDLARLTARDLRRKLDMDQLKSRRDTLLEALAAARDLLEPAEMSSNPAQNEQHHQRSEKELNDSEPAAEKTRSPEAAPPALPLSMILAACPELLSFGLEPVRHWHEFCRLAEMIRPMTGISPSAWEEAKQAMGPEQAAVVLAAMLERSRDIRSPGGYLRHLTEKARMGSFSPSSMILALLRRESSQL